MTAISLPLINPEFEPDIKIYKSEVSGKPILTCAIPSHKPGNRSFNDLIDSLKEFEKEIKLFENGGWNVDYCGSIVILSHKEINQYEHMEKLIKEMGISSKFKISITYS